MAETKHSAMPMAKPPTIAPGIEPMPPRTAATKAFRPSMEPMVGVACAYWQQYSTEPIPASAEPMAKVKEMVAFTLMPISWAAPVSSETARMALPTLVFCTSSARAIMETTDTAMVRMAVKLIFTPPMEMGATL